MARLKDTYREQVVQAMMEKFQYESIMQVPKIEKIVLNMGVGEAKENSSFRQCRGRNDFDSRSETCCNQSKKSISNFKLREGMPVGCKVTLRGDRMYEFFDKLVNIALPRVRDFRGVSKTAFDGRGNYALGIKEQLIFPEINYDKIDKIRGMDIIITTTANTDEEARELLGLMGMPFRK